MRYLLLLAMIAAAAFMAGWFTISRDGEHTTIQFNRNEIRNDAKVAIDRGREILNKQVQTPGAEPQYAPPSDQFAQPYPQSYVPNQQQPVQYPSWPEDRTAANPQADWNQRRSSYPAVQPASSQPTPWQPPVQYPGSPYPGQPSGYPVPQQY